ncbi:GNAT family N-acetyltransferase [Streptomyces sp. TRM49041]|uniref:GNAT family N-acetyltransferase n=1 Tax=Streptomyces sp. TRM49041 TaxID=2603216 RepID=UPI0011EBD707|nr:GNAT family N-acetyltransferase [Streptomyces sp. TRM49041]
MTRSGPRVRIDVWSPEDFDLLAAVNAPEMMTHLGGPETEEQLLRRHKRYVAMADGPPEAGRMFRIVLLPEEVPVGTIGFWEAMWDDEPVYETGWSVLPAFQGRGAATGAAVAVAERARAVGARRYLHAYPSIANGASNAVCRKAGFELLGERLFEYPVGRLLRSNVWRLDLLPDGPTGK